MRTGSSSRTGHRPPKLEVQDFSATTPTLSTGSSPQPGWPENNSNSPVVDGSRNDDHNATASQNSHLSTSTSNYSGSTLVVPSPSPSGISPETTPRMRTDGDHFEGANGGINAREMLPANNNGVSYAVAIYPYMAEQEDEFDVVVYVISFLEIIQFLIMWKLGGIHLSFYPGPGVGGWCNEIPRAPA